MNPAECLQLPVPRRVPYILKSDEIHRILAAIATLKSRPARHLLLLVVHTDLRIAEAKRLAWSEVSLADGKLYLLNSRVIDLNDDAINLFRSITRTSSELVVPSLRDPSARVTNIQKAWEEVRRRTKLNIRIDDLRNYSNVITSGNQNDTAPRHTDTTGDTTSSLAVDGCPANEPE
jgi:integrase